MEPQPVKFRRLPISKARLSEYISTDGPGEIILVPLERYELIEIADLSLMIRERADWIQKQKELSHDIRG